MQDEIQNGARGLGRGFERLAIALQAVGHAPHQQIHAAAPGGGDALEHAPHPVLLGGLECKSVAGRRS